jgi:hypothetical protein
MTIFTCQSMSQPVRLSTITITITVAAGTVCDGTLPALTVRGLPSTVERETRDRVRAGLLNSGLSLTAEVTVTVHPHVSESGSTAADLAIALAACSAAGRMRPPAQNVLVIGEVGLDGSVRAPRSEPGSVRHIIGAARQAGITRMVLPAAVLADLCAAEGMWLLPVTHLTDPALSTIDPESTDHRLRQFVREIAALTAEGDVIDGSEFEMENDDAWATLNALIHDARTLIQAGARSL